MPQCGLNIANLLDSHFDTDPAGFLQTPIIDNSDWNLFPTVGQLKCSWLKRQNNLSPFAVGVHLLSG
jgi:hypothetical protein